MFLFPILIASSRHFNHQLAIGNWQSGITSLFFRECHLLNIKKVKFNWCRATKDSHRNLQGGLVVVNFLDLTGKALERTRLDSNSFSRSVRELRLWFFSGLSNVVNNLIDFLWG